MYNQILAGIHDIRADDDGDDDKVHDLQRKKLLVLTCATRCMPSVPQAIFW